MLIGAKLAGGSSRRPSEAAYSMTDDVLEHWKQLYPHLPLVGDVGCSQSE